MAIAKIKGCDVAPGMYKYVRVCSDHFWRGSKYVVQCRWALRLKILSRGPKESNMVYEIMKSISYPVVSKL